MTTTRSTETDRGKPADGITGFFSAPFGLVLVAPLYAFTTWADAFVLQKLWTWNAVPLGLPALTLAQAMVPFLALVLLQNRYRSSVPEDTRTARQKGLEFGAYLCKPWLALAVGWWFT